MINIWKDLGFKMFCYEGLWAALSLALRGLACVHTKLSKDWGERLESRGLIKVWARQRSRYPKGLVFICSSAGEYEQAKPLLNRLQQRGDCALFILFFSNSGLKFAHSQKETLPFGLVASDRPSYWREVCALLRPDAFVCVRYELWPGMVHTSKLFAPLYLVDGVEAPQLRKKSLARHLRSSLLRPMKAMFLVSETDRNFYEAVLHSPRSKVIVTGDTKYDRVLERIKERQSALQTLKSSLKNFLADRRVIVLGSAWQRDLQAFLDIYQSLRSFDPQIAVIVAPHDLSPVNISAMLKMLEGLRVCQVSGDGYAKAGVQTDVLMVDVLGDLPELYGCCHLAWVGGAMHYRVHNVLEPACRGLYLCFGPLFETSQEAKGLVKQGLAHVINNGADFFQWYKKLTWATHPPHQALWQAVVEQSGASQRILQAITATWSK